MIHSFDTQIAEKYGVEKAVLIHNFVYWIEKNKANKKHFIEGKYWTYNSAKAFCELFPYMGSERKIARLLSELVEAGVLETANHNNDKRNQTKWYALSDEWISQIYRLQLPDLSNANAKNDNSHLPDLSNEYKETDSKQQIVNKQIGSSKEFSKLEKPREEKKPQPPTENLENKNQRMVRDDFWVTIADYKKLQADYFQPEIENYIERYNNWVKQSGKQARYPVGSIRKWMSDDGVKKKPSKTQRHLDEVARVANLPRFDWESDEGFYTRIQRYEQAGLHLQHDPQTRKWKTREAFEQSKAIAIACRQEFGYA